MTIVVQDKGRGNTLEASAACIAESDGTIRFFGNGNRVVLRGGRYKGPFAMDVKAGSRVEIGRRCDVGQLTIYADRGSTLLIADGCGFNGGVRLLLHEKGSILIGARCLFAGGASLTISDMHSIVDLHTGRRINPPRDIRIHDKVWIGQRATILKGVEIGTGSIIGAGSIVTRSIPANCIAAGNPARVVRRDVTWEADLLDC